ncbi:TetR family transcriptional regulator [Paracidovorax cattleyae]|uniref:Transcriptional regulator, TetR family n=1 Tax=Paracidovorax cattleyae TaxID=80868 RepID=A0A1H0VYE7_9BURK|nr:TetR family transcriptional regulator [Paracidovorax cattleyae]AVS76228.1 TetR family transcriptional regulator [Paracidovorax cattleyae]MBF9265990.1 TetR family transcriptional regulator [Paracidovorax cattleyae]SDP83547.1 transcriptional regulator, TetR family [Paracidovorax cattleyae]
MARRTKEDAVATRNSLLDAAEHVFYQKGVSNASLNDIAQAAGATRGAIYWHFKDKVDLFNAMMERVTLPLECASDECAGHNRMSPLQRLRAVIDFVLRSLEKDESMRRVFEIAMFRVEYVGELSAVRDRHVEASLEFRRQFAVELALAASDQGVELRTSADVAAVGLQALFDGLMQVWMLGGTTVGLAETGRAAVDAYLRGLGFDVPAGFDPLSEGIPWKICQPRRNAVP